MFSNHQLESILAQWPIGRLPLRSIEPVSGGLSGAHIWKIQAAGHLALSLGTESAEPAWALKAWPKETSLERLQEIHHLIGQAAATCDLISRPATTDDQRWVVRSHNRLWDCSPWVSGHPLPLDASRESLENAGQAIARVHQSMGNCPQQHVATSPRSIVHRLQRFPELSVALRVLLKNPPTLDTLSGQLIEQIPGPAEECHALAGVLTVAIERLRESWTLASHQIQQQLQKFNTNFEELPLRSVLRDVHRGHVFAEPADPQRKITGVIDYDAVGVDTPACDLARFAGSFGVDCVEKGTLQATTAGYRQFQSFSELEYDLAKTLMDANAIGGLANWVVWLIGERKSFHCQGSLIRDRISHLITSNCRIC